MVLIAPSLLSADMSKIGEEVELLEKAGADLLHFDVMDGHFVPNMTFGPLILEAIKKRSNIVCDVHLMVDNPLDFIELFAPTKPEYITFHIEGSDNPDDIINKIKKHGIKAGISIKPKTNINNLKKLSVLPDLVLVMGVEPGFGGQKFIPETIERIRQTKQIYQNKNVLISVDGGINKNNAKDCIIAGADILVAGSFIFKDGKYKENMDKLRGV